MHWLEKTLADNEARVNDGIPATGSKTKTKNSVSSPDILAECHKKLSDRWTVDYVTSVYDSEDANMSRNSLRRVSFAPCEKLAGEDSENDLGEEVEVDVPEMPTSSMHVEKESEVTVKMDQQDAKYPLACSNGKSGEASSSNPVQSEAGVPTQDSSPEPDLLHYTRPSHPAPCNDIQQTAHSDDDYLSYHIKKKLLALKLYERTKQKSLDRLKGLTSPVSSGSEYQELVEGKGKKPSKSKGLDQPMFRSTPDSDVSLLTGDESNPTDYYTPKQSLQDFKSTEMPVVKTKSNPDQDSDVEAKGCAKLKRGSDHDSAHSLTSSCSAPSFLIGSSTQLCQCIGDEDCAPNYRSLLDSLINSGGKTGGFFSSQPAKLEESPKDLSSSCFNSEHSPCPKDISSSFVSTPVSKLSIFSKEITSSCESTPKNRLLLSPVDANQELISSDTEVSSQGSQLCVVDESWWRQFEVCFENKKKQKGPENKLDDSQASESKPVLRKIKLDELLDRLYPDTNACHSEDDGETEEEVVTAESEIETGDESLLKDLVMVSPVLEELQVGNVTTYTQEEMNIEECNNESAECEVEPCLLDLATTAEPEGSPTPEHITIDIPEDMSIVLNTPTSLSAIQQEVDTPTTVAIKEKVAFNDAPSSSSIKQGVLQEKFSDAFGEFVCASPVKTNDCDLTKSTNTSSPCSITADLIDINFTDHEDETVEGDVKCKNWPPAPQDWPNLSATDQLLTLTAEEETGLSAQPVTQTSLSASQEFADQHDDNHLAMKRRLSVNIKKSTNDNDRALQADDMTGDSLDDSNNTSISSFTLSSLSLATDILEKSHDSLAKSVHDLCQRAIIKQSNISLELALPSEKLQVRGCGSKEQGSSSGKSSMLNVHLNSSIVYSTPGRENSKIF